MFRFNESNYQNYEMSSQFLAEFKTWIFSEFPYISAIQRSNFYNDRKILQRFLDSKGTTTVAEFTGGDL